MSTALKGALFVILIACVAAVVLRRTHFTNVSHQAGPIGSAAGGLQVLQQLREAGADLTKPTEVNYYLYFSDSGTAARAADSVRAFGFEAEVRSGRGRTQWLCLATNNMIPDTTAIFAATKKFSELTKRLGGDYDGWEAEGTK
ncbi:MAG: ribonuclease E inhibitor RraB [Gemmatimonadota bacterium]|nr:ribonuclease E inhibitor RraB [Gemmatimonadota bacterium]